MIEIKNLTKTYSMGAAQVRALDDVSLEIEAGEFVAIMGASGSGKSTLMHLMGLLDRPDSGSYSLNGEDVIKLSEDQLAAARNRLIGFVFQQFHLLPRMTSLENVELPLIYAGKRHLKEKAREKMEEVGLENRISHCPNELSGGQQQRVAIARSLVNEPVIILADEPTGNLDSRSQTEIMTVLKKLNENGKTVIIVTHEADIAAYAKRIIKMRDGKIVSDESNCKEPVGKCETKSSLRPRAEPRGKQSHPGSGIASSFRIFGTPRNDRSPALPLTGALEETQKFSRQAEFIDYLKQAFSAMVSHKMRTFLSILGILIGVAAVIAMLALGQGAQEAISKQLSSLGSNLLLVMPGSARIHGVAMGTGTVTRFTFQDVSAISKMSESVNRIYPSVQGRGQLVYGSKNWSTSVEGDGPDYAQMRNSVPVVGRFFTEEEVKLRNKVAVIGFTVARELFGDLNPVSKTMKINLVNFKVIGVLPAKGASGWHDQDDVVIIPVTTAMYRVFGKEYLDSIFVEVKSPDLIADTQNAITKLIIKQHRLNKDNEDTFQIRNMAELKQALEATTKTMSLLLGSIAAISLLVGGIGIMNIMLVSVTERTREIGLRKAIGARNLDIMVQFLIEAALIAFIGGVTGILLGAGVSSLIAAIAGWAVKLSPSSIILATGFSLLIGIIFGIWPARQASRLNPIEALRYE